MKIMCVHRKLNGKLFNSLTVGKIYTAVNVTERKEQFAYQSDNPYVFNIPDKDVYNIQDDNKVPRFYDTRLFKTLSEVRLEKINSII